MRLTSLGHAAVLVETSGRRILIDPWLTQRLDRFWEHHPALPEGLGSVLDGGVDHIVLSHHHYDHHHFPSLVGLAESAEVDFDDSPRRGSQTECLFPKEAEVPAFTGSGLGHQAIGWTLRRLGFERLTAVTPGDTVHLGGGVVLRTFASAVAFAEMSVLVQAPEATVMFCGDALLHESTVRFFEGPDAPAVDVAFVPAHSVSPPGVLTERRPVGDPGAVRARAVATFDRYVGTLQATLTVPSSFGWRISGDGERDYGWCNRTIFPFSPWEALARLGELGRDGLLWGPGQVLEVADGKSALHNGPHAPQKGYNFEAVYREVTLDPATRVPAFDPLLDRFGRQTRSAADLLTELSSLLVGTDLWYQAQETGGSQTVTLTDDSGATHCFLLDLVAGRVARLGEGPAGRLRTQEAGWTEIASATLEALLDARLLIGSSYGLWASDSELLSAVFHHPGFYTRHVDRALAASAGGSDE